MIPVATVLLLAALPFLLWPLLRPPPAAPSVVATPADPGDLAHQVEEVELDLASGRLDRRQADVRLAELRSERR